MHKLALTISLLALALTGVASAEAATLNPDGTVILSGTPSLLSPLPAPVGFSAKGRTALAARKKLRIARGTVLRFTSSEASRLSVVVERVQKARRKGRKVLRTRKVATLTRTIKVGAGRVSFTGRLGKRRLAAGTYRLTLTARDSAGNVSKPVSLTFTIVAG